MAGYDDPFTPGPTADPTAGLPDGNTFDDLSRQWNSFLSDPRGRGALLSAGLTMMQPKGFGQTGSGQIAQGIGAAGESVRTNEAADLKQQEASSKDELRAAQASAAGARSEASSARNDTSAARLALQQEDLKRKQEQVLTLAKIRLTNMYEQYQKGVQQRNEANSFLPKAQQKPREEIVDKETWIRQNPLLKNLGLLPEGEGGDTGAPATPAASTAPEAPIDPTQRVPNTVYKTPKGELKWTGTGWTTK